MIICMPFKSSFFYNSNTKSLHLEEEKNSQFGNLFKECLKKQQKKKKIHIFLKITDFKIHYMTIYISCFHILSCATIPSRQQLQKK